MDKYRKLSMRAALNKLRELHEHGEIDDYEEREKQIRRAFGEDKQEDEQQNEG